MKKILFFLLIGLCVAPKLWALSDSEARHLLSRTHFHVDEAVVHKLLSLDYQQAADFIVTQTHTQAQTPDPKWMGALKIFQQNTKKLKRAARQGSNEALGQIKKEALALFKTMPQGSKRVQKRLQNAKELKDINKIVRQIMRRQLSFDMQAWWIKEMVETSSPLTEKMTLFWHNHFVSSLEKVKVPHLLFEQNKKLRRHALGRFSDMLFALSKDPAMLIYLDGVKNVKGHPNENFAREVMELFTLGEGHYTEKDIQEAARAFTGWSVDRRTGSFVFQKQKHDNGLKTVLGESGAFVGDDILKILLKRKQTARYLVSEMWKEFVSLEPQQSEVNVIADRFFKSGFDIKEALKGLLTTASFYDTKNRGVLVKSPIELIVGSFRQFSGRSEDYRLYAGVARQMGQTLFNPPSVKGWDGGVSWISTNSLAYRKEFLKQLIRQADHDAKGFRMTKQTIKEGMSQVVKGMPGLNVRAWFDSLKGTDRIQRAQEVLLPIAAVNVVDPNAGAMALLQMITQDPAYQLK